MFLADELHPPRADDYANSSALSFWAVSRSYPQQLLDHAQQEAQVTLSALLDTQLPRDELSGATDLRVGQQLWAFSMHFG